MTPLFHPHIANVLGIITLGIWLHLFFGRGWFWRVGKLDADREPLETPGEWPQVMAVVPARNEEETIGRAVAGLVKQNYPGAFFVVVVDDHSEDATAGIAQQVADESGVGERVRIVSASALAEGWTTVASRCRGHQGLKYRLQRRKSLLIIGLRMRT
jgi:cellulose synthase/poly-beta-1,6-N-acetylglucosamine synthase-like glycosyltransferase